MPDEKLSCDAAVLSYLEQQNRPYSATDIFNNLHKAHGKTAIGKSLDALVQDGKIAEKTYGKQKVYAPLQDKYGDFDQSELNGLDGYLKDLQEKLSALQEQAKKQEKELQSFNSQISTTDAVQRIKSLESENQALSLRIESVTSGKKLLSKSEKNSIMSKHELMVKSWRKRKRMTSDVINCIMDGYPKAKRELLEEIGIETDEDAGVVLPV